MTYCVTERAKSVILDVKGQMLLGEDEFVDSLADHLKKQKHVPEHREASGTQTVRRLKKYPRRVYSGTNASVAKRWPRLSKSTHIGKVK